MSKKTVLKDTKEKPKVQEKSKAQIVQGRTWKLHKYWKGIMATILDPHERGHYKRMMLDATLTEHTEKNKKRKEKVSQADE
jgi:hypothetical protein